ncbi:MAG: response regulator [Candidatus Omnitrophica bacterium]|nr:response regulator [Candidatus Omnitrophota bacterium]
MAKKILLVDDEPDFVNAVKMRLEHSGYKVVIGHNGVECVEKALTEKPDLILLDVMMPFKDGYSALKDLKSKESTKGIPVIMLTAKPYMKELFEPEGIAGYMIKPFDTNKLLENIQTLLS